jgi:ribosome biogenesis protein BMS1
LPFASKPKLESKQKKPSLLQKRVIIPDANDKAVQRLIHNINTIRNEKQRKAKIVKDEKRKEYVKKKVKIQVKDEEMKQKRAKEFFKKKGQKEAFEMAQSRKKQKVIHGE